MRVTHSARLTFSARAAGVRRSFMGNRLKGTLPSLNALTYLQRLCVATRARLHGARRRTAC
jgi:hypothetical protein